MHQRDRRPRRNRGISRRRFLQLAAVSGATMLAGRAGFTADSEPLIRRTIPSSAQRVPVIGLGTARTFNVDPDDAPAMEPLRGVMRAFYEGGGRVVDSSPMYGHAEAVVGRLATELGIGDDLFMATKVWTHGREAGVEQIRRSERLMAGGRLDLVQVHNLVDLETQLATLRKMRDITQVRYIGVTHYTDSAHDELTRIVEREPIDFVQFNYNIGARNAEQRLLPAAADNGVATLINEPFESGRLFRRVRGHAVPEWARAELGVASWAQYFLKFIAGQPAVTCVIPATSKPKHSADNIGAGHGRLPDARQRDRMAREMAAL